MKTGKIKAILMVLALALFLCAFSACDGCSNRHGGEIEESWMETSSHTHVFDKWLSEGDYHWQQCKCGATSNREEHTFAAWQTDEEKHWKACICGVRDEEEEHFGEWIAEEEGHYKLCFCGKKISEGAHDFSTWQWLDDTHWLECVCGEKSGENTHTHGGWCFGGDYHWKECICGHTVQKTEHTLNEYNQCEVCFTYYGSAGLQYVLAESEEYYTVKAEKGAELTGKVFVAAFFEGKRVKGIGMSAFAGLSVTEIVMPMTIEIIEKAAFVNCKQLTTLKLPNSVKEIQEGAFSGCEKLNDISLPSGLTTIGNGAFWRCTNLKEVHFVETSGWVAYSSVDDRRFELSQQIFSEDLAAYLTGEKSWGMDEINLARCDWRREYGMG